MIASLGVAMIPTEGANAEEKVSVSSDFQLSGSTLVKYTGTAPTVSIPSTVKIIGSEAFTDNSTIKTVTIPSSVEEIRYAAFSGCNNLNKVVIPDSVESISNAAFCNCSSLSEINLGSGVMKLGTGIFAGCNELKGVSFSSASGNDHFVCDDGIIYNSDRDKIIEVLPGRTKDSYFMPATVTDIYPYAFYGCKNLTRVDISSNLTEIPAYSFSNCNGLKDLNISYSVNSIDTKAFENCISITDLTIPISVTFIHDTAFDGCSGLNIVAPEKSYAYRWFETHKKDLTAIIDDEDNSDKKNEDSEGKTEEERHIEIDGQIGETVIVGRQAVFFIDNTNLTVKGSDISNVSRTDITDIINDMEGALQKETNGKGLSLPKFAVIGDKIANKAFYGSKNLASYEISDDIRSIGDFSFARSNLKTITIPDGVTHIGYGAFYHCDDLVQVLVPLSVTDIEPAAFKNTRMLDNWLLYGDDDFLIMGDGILLAYRGRGSSVTIPDTVKQIGPEVFMNRKDITDVYISDSVVRICEDAFSGCVRLKNVSGGMNVRKIEDRAFYNCPLATVRITDSVREIGLGAFSLEDSGLSDEYKVALFQGDTLPIVTYNKTATRLSNDDFRTDALNDIRIAIVNNENVNRAGTVLDRSVSGFSGLVCSVIDENNEYFNGTLRILDCTLTPEEAEDLYFPETFYIYGKGYNLRTNELESVLDMARQGLYDPEESAEDTAEPVSVAGSYDRFLLDISKNETADEDIKEAYRRIYSDTIPQNLTTYDLTLHSADNEVMLTKLGNSELTVHMDIPSNIPTANLHVICLDSDGQLEDLPYRVVNEDGALKLNFTVNQMGKYGLYAYSGVSGSSENLDDSPDTGDPIHPKWFLSIGLMAAGLAMFLIKEKEKVRRV